MASIFADPPPTIRFVLEIPCQSLDLRAMEHRSQCLFPWREWKAQTGKSWSKRAQLAVTHPLHYPRKLLTAVKPNR